LQIVSCSDIQFNIEQIKKHLNTIISTYINFKQEEVIIIYVDFSSGGKTNEKKQQKYK